MSPVVVLVLGSLAGLAALLTAVRETAKWLSERRSNEIGHAIDQWRAVSGEMVDQLRAENDRLVALNERQREQIDKLETENGKLEILTRSLSQQNMDVAHEAQRARRELEALMKEHHELLGRLKERDDAA